MGQPKVWPPVSQKWLDQSTPQIFFSLVDPNDAFTKGIKNLTTCMKMLNLESKMSWNSPACICIVKIFSGVYTPYRVKGREDLGPTFCDKITPLAVSTYNKHCLKNPPGWTLMYSWLQRFLNFLRTSDTQIILTNQLYQLKQPHDAE